MLGLDWTPDADTLIYGKYNRGYKPGGFGAAATFGLMLATPYTDKEIRRRLRGRLETRMAEPESDHKRRGVLLRVQRLSGLEPGRAGSDPRRSRRQPTPRPYTAYLNLPKIDTTGFEIETIWRPTDNLRFLFNYGYIDPKIKGGPILINSTDPYALERRRKPAWAA